MIPEINKTAIKLIAVLILLSLVFEMRLINLHYSKTSKGTKQKQTFLLTFLPYKIMTFRLKQFIKTSQTTVNSGYILL